MKVVVAGIPKTIDNDIDVRHFHFMYFSFIICLVGVAVCFLCSCLRRVIAEFIVFLLLLIYSVSLDTRVQF